jgi:hypothetical protein
MFELIAFLGGIVLAVISYYAILGIYAGMNGSQPLSNDGMPPYLFHQHISQPFTEA